MIKIDRITYSLLSFSALCFLPTVAWTQTVSSILAGSLNPTSVRAKNDGLVLQKEADARLVQGSLATDLRLNVKVTLHKENSTLADTLKTLSEATHIKLTAEGTEVINAHVCVFATKTPLRDVLDGIAHLHDWEWKALKDKSLELHTRSRSNQWDGVRPNTEAQAEQYAQGRQFLSLFANCAPALQNALTDMQHNGIAFSSLPPEMQQTVQSMLIAAGSTNAATDGKVYTPSPDNSAIRLQQGSRQEWGNTYYVEVFDGQTSIGLDFPVFNDPNQNTDQIVPVSALKSVQWYGVTEDGISREKIAKNDTCLHVPVTLNYHDVSIAVSLQSLEAATGINFAADLDSVPTPEGDWTIASKSIKVSGKPLIEALDQLATLYHQTWGQTSSGMIVFHGAPEKPVANSTNTL